MRIFPAVTAFILLAAANPALAESPNEANARGQQIFEDVCTACHVESMSAAEVETAQDISAPPMNLLTTIIRKKTGNSQDAFVAHVVDFTTAPQEDKIKAMKEALKRFGLMPPVAAIAPYLSLDDLKAVATWLYGHYDYDAELKAFEAHRAAEAAKGH